MSSSSQSFINGDEEFCVDGSKTLHILPQEILRTIDEIIQSTEPFDNLYFNSVDYINTLFPTEQSLSSVDDVMALLKCKISDINDRMRILVRGQDLAEKQSKAVLMDAHQVVRQLNHHILEIKNTAEKSENTVIEIIHDIKLLDCAKRNLTTAITTLNHLQIIVRSLDSIKVLTNKRNYGEIVGPLQGVVEVIKHLQNYTRVSKVSKLINEIRQVQEDLSQQAMQDFCETITGENVKHSVPTKSLTDICLIINILDPTVKHRLLKWFIKRQMDEYLLLFNEIEESSWLDKVDCRYTWFKKYLIQFENKFGLIFPPEWKVSERVTINFCHITKTELTKIMGKRAKEIDVKVLLYAFQKTLSFEQLLTTRFTGHTLFEESNKSTLSNKNQFEKVSNPTSSTSPIDIHHFEYDIEKIKEIEPTTGNGKEISTFHNIIAESFLPYLYIFIESVDKSLYEIVEKFVAESRTDFDSVKNQNILPSSADLFVLYKKFLVQCSQLSNGPPMLSLSSTFGKHLREYAHKILQNSLPKLRGSSIANSLSNSMTTITRDLKDMSSASSVFQNFLKEVEEARFSKDEIIKICCILTTAEYCLETTRQLEDRLKMKVDPFLADKVNFSQEQDIFFSVISNCIHLLVSDLESACQTALSAMNKIQWQTLETAGDESSYITTIISQLKASIPLIKESLSSSRKYFTRFCVSFAKMFIPKFVQSLYKCKPLSVVGAEQLLLDTQTLKTALLDMPSMGSQVSRQAPDCYNLTVVKGMSHGEKILKLVMASHKPEAAFVNQFFNLLPNSNIQEFQKILEMKGLRATDKSNLLTVFCIHYSTGFVADSPSSLGFKNEFDSVVRLKNLVKSNILENTSI